MAGHIIPTANEQYDIGSVDNKVRDIYVSSSSIWMGETHKIAVVGGSLKFNKIDKGVVPSKILSVGLEQIPSQNTATI